jgi:hypothetical protein
MSLFGHEGTVAWHTASVGNLAGTSRSQNAVAGLDPNVYEQRSRWADMLFNAACSSINRESAPTASTTNTNIASQEREVPSRG